jgi:hypothetical protein
MSVTQLVLAMRTAAAGTDGSHSLEVKRGSQPPIGDAVEAGDSIPSADTDADALIFLTLRVPF